MIRICPKCAAPTAFPPDHNSRRGYCCNPCKSQAAVEWARSHRDKKRAYNNAYSARRSAKRSAQTAAYRAKHPEKRAAHQAVQAAVRNGTLIPDPCIQCGNSKAHAHHDDYAKPLSIIWLCHLHHMERHSMLKAQKS